MLDIYKELLIVFKIADNIPQFYLTCVVIFSVLQAYSRMLE